MRRCLFIGCAILLLATLPSSSAAEPVLVNGVAVIVNDAIITRENIVEATLERERLIRDYYRSQPQTRDREIERLRSNALDNLVERELILHEFNTAGYKLPESVVEEHVKGTIRERFGDRPRMIKSLHAEGVTSEEFRRRVREEFIIGAMVAKNISQEIMISPYKIETYYKENQDKFKVEDQVKLRMIVLTNKVDRNPEATRKFADEVAGKIAGGASFAEMASVYSDGSQRSQGGDWGWIERSVLRSELAEVAFSLKPGERSAVIEKPEGCYLMLVEESRPAHVRPLSEVRDAIEKELKVKEQQRLRKQWIERLKAKSFIRYFPLS
jgi:plasmid stabilization system protein ParE